MKKRLVTTEAPGIYISVRSGTSNTRLQNVVTGEQIKVATSSISDYVDPATLDSNMIDLMQKAAEAEYQRHSATSEEHRKEVSELAEKVFPPSTDEVVNVNSSFSSDDLFIVGAVSNSVVAPVYVQPRNFNLLRSVKPFWARYFTKENTELLEWDTLDGAVAQLEPLYSQEGSYSVGNATFRTENGDLYELHGLNLDNLKAVVTV